MGDVEFEVISREGKVEMIMFDENDDMDVVSMEPENAAVLAAALFDAVEESQ